MVSDSGDTSSPELAGFLFEWLTRLRLTAL
jgi:hypothetical protein